MGRRRDQFAKGSGGCVRRLAMRVFMVAADIIAAAGWSRSGRISGRVAC